MCKLIVESTVNEMGLIGDYSTFEDEAFNIVYRRFDWWEEQKILMPMVIGMVSMLVNKDINQNI